MLTDVLERDARSDLDAQRLVPRELGVAGVAFHDGKLVVAWPSEPNPGELARVAAAVAVPITPLVVDQARFDELMAREDTSAQKRSALAEQILDTALTLGASDIHLLIGSSPIYRVAGVLGPFEGQTPLSAAEMTEIGHYLAGDKIDGNWSGDLDIAAAYKGWRLRVSLFRQRGGLSSVIRLLSDNVPSFEALHLPDVIRTFAELPMGLVLLAGPTGSGKTTTLACLLDLINTTRTKNIITIEDPIEYVHGSKMSVIRQREIGSDTVGFAEALRAALRQDPDVILVGEMRDHETIETTLTAAETGHLVLSTVHANDTRSSVDRVVDVFPHGQQQQIRTQLSAVLAGVVTQSLLPSADEPGRRRVICEVMVANDAIRAHIRTGDSHHIPNDVATGIASLGMQPFDYALAQAVNRRQISRDDAALAAHDAKTFGEYMSRGVGRQGI